jgi:hypothetical protein
LYCSNKEELAMSEWSSMVSSKPTTTCNMDMATILLLLRMKLHF